MNAPDEKKSALVQASSTALARTGSQALVRRGLRDWQNAEQKAIGDKCCPEDQAQLLFCLDHQCAHGQCPDVLHLDFALVPLKNANLPGIQSSIPEEPAGEEESDSQIKPAIDLVGDDKWGRRGRERCSCGKVLELDEDWYCRQCGLKLEYFVVVNASGGHLIHDSEIPVVTKPNARMYWQVPDGALYGPFPREEAEAVLAAKNKIRNR